MKQLVVLVLVYIYVNIEHYFEAKRLSEELEIKSSELASKTLALEENKLVMMESDLYQQLSVNVESLEAERDQLHEQLLKANNVNNDLKRELTVAEWKISDLNSDLEREENTVLTFRKELSNSQKRVEQLRDENDEAKRRIDNLKYEIEHDPRNGCKCLCGRFDEARFCTSQVYWMATYVVRQIPGSSFILGALDYLFKWIEPELHRIGRQPSYLLS